VIFVDTSAWYAAFVPSDRNFATADSWIRANDARLVTTDYIVDELITLMDKRGERRRGALARTVLLEQDGAELIFVSPDDFREAWELHDKYRDKDWSFTDCTSYVVMQRLGITSAFSFDVHFRQFGTVSVIP
jgi:predicted nucleic acid-binding protein